MRNMQKKVRSTWQRQNFYMFPSGNVFHQEDTVYTGVKRYVH